MRNKVRGGLFAIVILVGITGSAEPLHAVPADEAIETHIQPKLQRNFPQEGAGVTANVQNGVATLRGTVSSLPETRRFERIASTSFGVTRVVNQLQVADSGRSDAAIAQDVHAAFQANPAIDSGEIKVDVRRGQVTLTGTVDSFAEKWVAGQIAANVTGVRQLKNRLVLQYVATRPDQEILADIKSRLAWDRKVDASRLRVSVQNGRVQLTGSVTSPAEKMWARFDAWVAGVQAVNSTGLLVLVSPGEKREPVQMTDLAIEQAVNSSFLLHPDLSLAPKVAVDSGIVTLSGKVDTLRAKRLAAQVASEIAGVRQVRNKLQVTPGSVGRGDLVQSVKAAMQRDPYLERLEIAVHQSGHRVRLSGYVDSEFERERAESIASGVPGVVTVVDDLEVTDNNPVYYWRYAPDSDRSTNADRQLQDAVEDKLFWSPYVQADRVIVSVHDGIVTLTGWVQNALARKEAANNAYEAGALRVQNNLAIWPANHGEVLP